MAAIYHITQDSEKENPRNKAMKEKLVTTNKSHVLQPLGASALGGPFKDQPNKQGRANFSLLNNNPNARVIISNSNNNAVGGGNPNIANNTSNKLAFRELGNVKAKDENAGYGGNRHTANLALKKSIVEPMEQFKTFSVYEDKSDAIIDTHTTTVTNKQQPPHYPAAATIEPSHDVVGKENCYGEKQQQKKQQRVLAEKSDSLVQKYEENEYTLDTTPMSVSEILSPMSVDRSVINSQLFTDDSNSEEIADISESSSNKKLQLPRNDRQRFFEVVEYQRDILEYFRESEKKHRPKPHYMRRQTDINYSMRAILVDWLVEVSEEYNLDTETLYLSVSYIDRFLSHMSVVRNKLQLVGTAAMYIASKYEEIYPPDVSEFVFITDDTYNKAQVLRMEQIILKILAFDLCTPTAYVFTSTYSVLIDIPDKVKYLTLYICELSLLEADPYLRFYPSIISAAALALARFVCDLNIWSTELEEITTYRLEDLKEVLLCLCKSHNAAVTLAQQAIPEKYKAEKLLAVSTIKPVDINEQQYDLILKNYNEMLENAKRSKELISTPLTAATAMTSTALTSPKKPSTTVNVNEEI